MTLIGRIFWEKIDGVQHRIFVDRREWSVVNYDTKDVVASGKERNFSIALQAVNLWVENNKKEK